MLTNFHTHFIKGEGREILNLEHLSDEENNLFSYGIHPKDSATGIIKEDILLKKNCLAIGEIGLDKLIDVDFEQQKRTFIQQIELSEKYKLPVILHCVKAWNEILEIKKQLKVKQKWIFHGFRKTSLLESVLKNNVVLGIGTAILFDKKLQVSLKEIPLDAILLETDADENNSILSVYEKVAEIKNISLQELEFQIKENFKNTFKKWEIG